MKAQKEIIITQVAFQKVVEENKRLRTDIKILTGFVKLPYGEKEMLVDEWNETFKKEQWEKLKKI